MLIYHVYILASANGVFYVGVTNDIEVRTIQHKQKLLAGFTKDHDVTRLVHFEPFHNIKDAIAREKQIKRWRREKKLALIRTINPQFRDLFLNFHR